MLDILKLFVAAGKLWMRLAQDRAKWRENEEAFTQRGWMYIAFLGDCISFQCRLKIAGWLQLQLVSIKAEGFVPVVPSECEALGYCDQTLPDYPEEHVDQLIKENGLVSPGVVDVTKETRRQDPSEVQLCDFTKKTILPQVARDTSGKWKYIVNLPHNTFQQQFLVEICKNENSACSPVFHPPIGYTASCQQKFISKALVALDDQGQKVEENFTIPSSCYCQVKQTM